MIQSSRLAASAVSAASFVLAYSVSAPMLIAEI
jgi:hypothetical protein